MLFQTLARLLLTALVVLSAQVDALAQPASSSPQTTVTQDDAPAPYGPVPTAAQMAWHQREMQMFIHFGPNTFTGLEWGEGGENPKLFAPTALDAKQWARIAKEAGMEAIILTTKHHDGFCLWPCALTEHDVAASGWSGGKRDVLGELSAACATEGLGLGVYLSPWDRNNPKYGTGAEYNAYFKAQLREVLGGKYGPIVEMWFDGACGEGPNGKRQTYDFPAFNTLVHELQPGAVIFSDAGPEVRWVGNERGIGSETHWCRLHRDKFFPGTPHSQELGVGHRDGTHWVPAECDVSIRPGWFHHPDTDAKVKSVDELEAIWYASVGRGCGLLLNVPPDRRGLIHDNDAAALRGLKARLDATFAHDLARKAAASATTTRSSKASAARFSAQCVIDNDAATYWATDDAVHSGTLTLTLAAPASVGIVRVDEHIELGQRVAKFHVDALCAGTWKTVAGGTTIGARRILRFDAVQAAAIRIVIDEALAAPCIAAVQVFAPAPAQEAKWNGYAQHKFVIGGHAAYVVAPAICAPGKPWIWRTSWPDYHFEVDMELLRCGYHIGYIEVVDMLGSDPSLELMDRFYEHARSQWGLAAIPALEANSRGGLHAYRYAVRHPERVACILGDVPVMDFKSWPLKHAAAKGEWKKILASYGFANDAQAMAYGGNPIDQLAAIAKAKIPLRHTICLTDRVVPPEQNTLEAQRRLQKLGWDLDVVAVPDSKELEGHHFPFPAAFASARFVMRHADVLPTAGRDYFQLRYGLANCKTQFETKKTGRVAFLGGSITFNSGWREELMHYLKEMFPGTAFDFIAAGIPSVGSNGHAFRLDQDIFMNGPVDLLFVEAAVNDGTNIASKPELMLRSMEGVIRHVRTQNPLTDIVQMHFFSGEAVGNLVAGKTPVAVAQHERVATHYGCVSLDLIQECAERVAAGEFTWANGFNSDVHPPPYGQRVYANSMMRMLDAGFATANASKPHSVPQQLLDNASYMHGRYAALEDAALGQGFKLESQWRPAKGGTRDDFVNVPVLVASNPGAEFTYNFTGTAFGLFLAAGYDTCVLEFSIDGSAFQKLDTYTPWSAGLHLPWPIMLADGLKDGKHRVVVRTTDDVKARTALHVVHVLVN